MAAAAASALLDELMGRDRNLNPAEKKRELRWDDPQVCKHFMSKFCPNELFINTRADLGPCDKIHDEFMKQEYEKSASYQRMGYEEDFIKFCQGMLADVERRIRRGKQRLALGNQEGSVPNAGQVQNNDDQIKILTERVNGMLEQVEALGCEGKVEEAQGIMKLCDQLKEERENLRRANENSHWLQTAEIAAAQEKQMEVCEVCGAFLIVGDAQQRVDDHLMGKQHMGYARIKIALEEMLEKKQKDKEEREKQREKDREERMQKRKEEETEKSKKRDEERRKEKKRSRSRSRGHKRSRSRDRKKSRSRSRDRKRSRSRNRSSRKHSYGKERRRSRSRSRGRSSRKSRRSRSRSRSRDRHRSSGDKRRDRDRDRDSRRSSEKEKEKGKKSPTPKDDANSTSEDKHFSSAKESADGDSHSDVQNNGTAGERNGVSVGGSEAKINGAVCEGD